MCLAVLNLSAPPASATQRSTLPMPALYAAIASVWLPP